MTLDLGCPVGDAAWAPYSATVLAAAGEDGRLQVDLSRTNVFGTDFPHRTCHLADKMLCAAVGL